MVPATNDRITDLNWPAYSENEWCRVYVKNLAEKFAGDHRTYKNINEAS
jgi:hypothetical protein